MVHSQTDQLNFEESQPTIIGLNFDYGFLLPHTQALKDINDAYPIGISLDWSQWLLTKNAWDFCNCFPRVGAEISYWDWDNPEILGHGVLALGYVEPYFRTQKRTNFFVRLGMGGAYLSNPFDLNTNSQNSSYSTHINFALMVGLGINYRLTQQHNLRLAAKYNHTSNGGIRTPNKGLNFPSISLGINTSLEKVQFPIMEKIGRRQTPEDKTRWSLTHFSGWSNASVGDKDKFYVFGFMANYSRWIGNRSALTAGTEWIFDYSRREQIELDGLDANFLQGSLLLGHEFWLGKVAFSQQLGIYYFNEYRITDDVYQRYGLTYDLNHHIFAGFNLKAHRHVADFFDIRIGYRF